MTPTAELIERLRAYAKYRPVPTAQTSHSLAEAADRLAELEKRITELEAVAETDYLHLAMEQKKRIAELERDSKIVDWLATFWDSQSTATQSILGAEYANPTGSFRDAILSAIEQGQAGIQWTHSEGTWRSMWFEARNKCGHMQEALIHLQSELAAEREKGKR